MPITSDTYELRATSIIGIINNALEDYEDAAVFHQQHSVKPDNPMSSLTTLSDAEHIFLPVTDADVIVTSGSLTTFINYTKDSSLISEVSFKATFYNENGQIPLLEIGRTYPINMHFSTDPEEAPANLEISETIQDRLEEFVEIVNKINATLPY